MTDLAQRRRVRDRLGICHDLDQRGAGSIQCPPQSRAENTDLVNPDFLTLANAYGLSAERVTLTADFGPALRRALAASGSTLIELVTDAQAIAHTMTLSEIRTRAKS